MSERTFVATTSIAASAEAVFEWHEAPGAFERLTPPWARVRVVRHEGGIRDGARVSLLVGWPPLSFRWDLEHVNYHAGRSFTDRQVRGPFRSWRHHHRMIPSGPHACVLEDRIEYELPFGVLGLVLGGPLVSGKLRQLFAFRHGVTKQAFEYAS